MFIGVQGVEGKDNSLLIAGRPSMLLGIRLRVFQRNIDGPYKEKGKQKLAVSWVMVADLKMRNFRIRGSGDELSDVVTIANVHMHARTAKKELQQGGRAYKTFLG